MKKIMLVFIVLFLSMLFFSCETDYKGPEPTNTPPTLTIYDTSDSISNKQTRVQWYGNDEDGTSMTYYYSMTTDTTLGTMDAEATLAGVWQETSDSYVNISMPFAAYPDTLTAIFIDDSVYTDPAIADSIVRKIVFSKFFLYGVDEGNKKTPVVSKIFGRTNKIPKHPMINSKKLEVNGFDKYWFTIGADSAVMVLEKETSFWKPIDFRWIGEDPDGADVDLEFKWELWALNGSGELDDEKISNSNDWSMSYLSIEFSDVIFNHDNEGKFSFRVWVRDDALEESENHATVNFEVYAPQLDRGILLIDDTDPDLYPPSSYIMMGNPNSDSTTVFYESLLKYSGFKPENEAIDSLELYRIKRFTKKIETVSWDYEWGDDDGNPATPEVIVDSVAIERGFYSPDIRELSRYKLVIIASDDRSNSKGVDFGGMPPYTGYGEYLASYLDVGGNVMLLGNSVLMGKLYNPQLPIKEYRAPYRQVFDPDEAETAALSDGTLDFFSEYFGIYSMTFPEAKTYFTENSTVQLAIDPQYADNYDFIGLTPYDHIDDVNIGSLRIDSTRVNDAWWNRMVGARVLKQSLKDNGSVFTGVPTLQAFKGEVVYKYESIYDLPRDAVNDSLSVDGDLSHFLYWTNRLTGETGPVLRRSGTVATRYIADGDIFRTAFFGIPTYFLDNSENQVSDMFKAMVDWFEIK